MERTFWRLCPRGFQNEFTIGIATTKEDAEQYDAEGFDRINQDRAIAAMSRRPENSEDLFRSVTVDGVLHDDCYELAREIRKEKVLLKS